MALQTVFWLWQEVWLREWFSVFSEQEPPDVKAWFDFDSQEYRGKPKVLPWNYTNNIYQDKPLPLTAVCTSVKSKYNRKGSTIVELLIT